MNYKKLIADSWRFTQENKGLIYWFGFLPSLLSTTIGIGYLGYQFFAFKKSFLFDDSETSFFHDVAEYGWSFVSEHATLTVPLAVVGIILIILWLLVPTLTKAASFQAIARSKNGQKSGVGIGLKYGLMAFLPLFEFHLLVKTFSPMSMVTEASFVMRNLGMGIFYVMAPVFIVIFVISLVLVLLFTYSDLYIVIDGEGVLSSMKKSAKLVILNWQHTILITILMLIIGVRIIIQAFLIFLIPAVALLTAGYVATLALEVTALIIAGSVGVLGLILAAYLGGVVDIFAYTVWTYTFLELTSQGEISARDQAKVETAPKEDHSPKMQVQEPADLDSIDRLDEDDQIPPSAPPPDISGSEDSIPGLL
jgi:hypothetical protein